MNMILDFIKMMENYKIIDNNRVIFKYITDNDLIPKNFKNGSKYKRTGKAGIFAGSLELVKEGNLSIKQDNLFDEIYIREIND